MIKVCTKCKVEKELVDFHKSSSRCKLCVKESDHAKYMKNRERRKLQNKEWAIRNLERYKEIQQKYRDQNKDKKKNTALKRDFGITLDRYNEMFISQKGCCNICKTAQSNLKYKLAVDHDHITGEIRGLLCMKCNRGIGYLRDSVEILQQAIIHLTKESTKLHICEKG